MPVKFEAIDPYQWISTAQFGIVASGGDGPSPPGRDDEPPPPPAADEPPPIGDPPTNQVPEPPSAADPSPAPAPKPDWREKQLGKVRGENKDLKSRLAALEAELAPFKAQQQPKPAAGLSEADVERRAEERARAIAAETRFAADIQQTVEAGKTAFEDWEPQMTQLAQIVDQTSPVSTAAYTSMIQAAMVTGAAPQVLYSLSKDLNEAQRIMDLPPVQMGVELTKLALKPPSEVSGTPKPIRPVGGTNASRSEIRPDDPERSDGLSIDEWMRRRNASAWDQKDRRRA